MATGFEKHDDHIDETGAFDPKAFQNWVDAVNETTIEVFRNNKGRVGTLGDGLLRPLLFTHTGRKSGKQYTTPIAAIQDNDTWVITASMSGSPVHPQWYHNLIADPNVIVEVGEEKFAARARVAEGEERERLFKALSAGSERFEIVAARSSRVFPVIVFERV